MKTDDMIGFAAILSAGFLAGKDYEAVSLTTWHLLAIIALLVVGYYFAVNLS